MGAVYRFLGFCFVFLAVLFADSAVLMALEFGHYSNPGLDGGLGFTDSKHGFFEGGGVEEAEFTYTVKKDRLFITYTQGYESLPKELIIVNDKTLRLTGDVQPEDSYLYLDECVNPSKAIELGVYFNPQLEISFTFTDNKSGILYEAIDSGPASFTYSVKNDRILIEYEDGNSNGIGELKIINERTLRLPGDVRDEMSFLYHHKLDSD
ncbi:MAG: hypothetical protein LBP22_08955 [Deltaproteobacteria bacterium]|jgi:hypothetical protein|nr:hypothetical protein [Deltaproteobacteria bacterium]